MRTLSLFNHKGGVGKTTLTVNLADAIEDLGKKILLVDTDPQCNLSAFYLPETKLDEILGVSSDEEKGDTVWSAVKPVVLGRGDIKEITPIKVSNNIHLLVGDVLLSQYEEELPSAWIESFARKPRGYDVMCALSRVARRVATNIGADLIMYDIGPNVGPLNRTVILDSDFFLTPVHTDLYSLRALTTVGTSLAKWIKDWGTVRALASVPDRERLLLGHPRYLGYVSSAYQTYGGKKARPHEYWEKMIPHRVKSRVVDPLRSVGADLAVSAPYKLQDIPNFHSLAAKSQEFGLAVGQLRGYVDSGHYEKVDEVRQRFASLAKSIVRRVFEE